MQMRFPTSMALATLALVACSPEQADPSSATPAEEVASTDAPADDSSDGSESQGENADITFVESGWLTVGTDGAVQTTFFDAGGRYRDYRNGDLFASGTWQQRPDGRLCFEPESGRGACWSFSKPDENGDVTATNADGKAIEIKRVTYVAPTEDETVPEREN